MVRKLGDTGYLQRESAASSIRLRALSLAVGLVGLLIGRAEAGQTINDLAYDFRLTIPDGFDPAPEFVRGDVLYAFTRKPADGRHCGVTIAVERMRGTIGQQVVKRELADAGRDASLRAGRWKDFEVPVFRIAESEGGRAYVTLNTQVPLDREAIQIKVFGDAADEGEIWSISRDLLDNLDGPSIWVTPGEQIAGALQQLGGVALAIGIPLVLILFGMRQSRARSRVLQDRGELDDRRPRRRRPRRPRCDFED